MIAVDTNLLVYSSRAELSQNEESFRRIAELAEGTERWALPWPCLAEFLCVVTNSRLFPVPTPVETALDQVDAWIDAGPVLLAETPRTWDHLRDLVGITGLTGPRLYDARIAAICLDHEVRELWTSDRDFSLFPKLRTRNPLMGGP
ncbi:MAG TPA: TA system VapC family ribonuclease toxin [Pseudonocardiaceae bacterium]